MQLTIGIKAFNEERHIARALSAAVVAARAFDGEVLLADCGSTDRTTAIAKTFPVQIVQLADSSQRSCGAGAQLAFQHAAGDYFFLQDGDMVLNPGFLPEAMAFLHAHPEVAGVGGFVREINLDNEEFRIRANSMRTELHRRPGLVDRLDGGGLYRAVAIREAGYFADINLHAFEEFDLAMRLHSCGWKLARINSPAVDHFGHQTSGYGLLWRRVRSGYASAAGEVLRAAIGRPYFFLVLRKLGHIRNGFAVITWWGLLIAALVTPVSAPQRFITIVTLLAGPLSVLAWRRGSLRLGLYSLAAWNLNAFGLLVGLVRRRVSPTKTLTSVATKPASSSRTEH